MEDIEKVIIEDADLLELSRQNEDIKWWIQSGLYYGYPKCCIIAFCTNKEGVFTRDQLRAAGNKGFMPCPDHATQIIKRRITIESLIKNRIHDKPFPLCIMQEAWMKIASKLKNNNT